jgi:hypothetical protein
MTTDPTQLLLLFAGVAFGVFGVVALVSGLAALLRARPLRFVARTLSGLLLAGAGTLALAVAFGSQGYRALTQEQPAGRIAVHSTGPQRFDARFVFPDGREATYALAGDEIYIDAHIIKWKPIANLVGLSTAYELDRIGGRYRSINQERDAERTVHPLAPSRPVDLFELRRRYAFLAPLFDAEYGSASFVPVNGDAELQLLVSPTGLLLRPRS